MRKYSRSKRTRICAILLAAALVVSLAIPSSVLTASAESSSGDPIAAENGVRVSAYEDTVDDVSGDVSDDASDDTSDDTSGDTSDDTSDDVSDDDSDESGTTVGDSDTGNDTTDDGSEEDADSSVSFAFSDSNAALSTETDEDGNITRYLILQEDASYTASGTVYFTLPDGYSISAASSDTAVATAEAAAGSDQTGSVTVTAQSAGTAQITVSAEATDEGTSTGDGSLSTESLSAQEVTEQTLTFEVTVQQIVDLSSALSEESGVSEDAITLTGEKVYDGSNAIDLTAELGTDAIPANAVSEGTTLSSIILTIPAEASSSYVQEGGTAVIDWSALSDVTVYGIASEGTDTVDLTDYYLLVNGSSVITEETEDATVSDAVTITAESLTIDTLSELLSIAESEAVQVTKGEDGNLTAILTTSLSTLNAVLSSADARYDTASVSANADGTYTFTFQLSTDTTKATATSYTTSGSDITITIDEEAPSIAISYLDTDYSTDEESTYLTEDAVALEDGRLWYNASNMASAIVFTATDDSGVSTVSYAWISVAEDASEDAILAAVSALTEDDWTEVTVDASATYYDASTLGSLLSQDATLILVVKAADSLGNTTTKTSTGVGLDLKAPEVSVAYDDADQEIYGMGEDSTVSVDYTAVVSDPVYNSTSSGIASIEITASTWDAGSDADTADTDVTTYSIDEGTTYDTLSSETVTKEYSDTNGETVSYSCTQYTIADAVLVSGDTSRNVKLSVTAYDAAGNSYTAESDAVIADCVDPVVTAAYDTTEEDACYQSRSLTVAVTERAFEEEDVVFSIVLDDAEEASAITLAALLAGDYKSAGITASKKTTDAADGTDTFVTEYTISFSGLTDTDYSYAVTALTVTDQAENVTEASLSDTDSFVIDNTYPELSPAFDATDADGCYEERTLSLNITEENYSEANVVLTINGTAYTLAQLRAGELDGVSVADDAADVIFSGEGTYTVTDIQVTDDAEHTASYTFTEAEGTFTIDHTEPQDLAAAFDTDSDLPSDNDGTYYQQRVLAISFTEEHYSEDDVLLAISTDGGQTTNSYSITQLRSEANGIDGVTVSPDAVSEDGAYVITFGGDDIDTDFVVSSVTVTDLSDLPVGVSVDASFTIDTVAPVIAVSYTVTDDAGDAVSVTPGTSAENTLYEDRAVTATIAITERSFDEEDVEDTITASLNGGAVTVPETGSWSANGDTYTAAIVFESDADYTYALTYTDKAGNAAVYTDAAGNTSDSYDTQYFTVDTQNPGVSFAYAADGEVADLSIVYFNEETLSDLTVTFTIDETGSGIAYAAYTWVDAADANSTEALAAANWTEIADPLADTAYTVVNPDPGESSSNKVLVVYVKDFATNDGYYTSDATVQIDLMDPVVELSVTSDPTDGIYGTDGAAIAYTVTVSDPADGILPSGIDSIVVSVVVNGEEVSGDAATFTDSYTLDADAIAALTSETLTDADGCSYVQYTFGGTVTGSTEESRNVTITVTAYDAAGNPIDTDTTTAKDSFSGLADGKAPELTLSWSGQEDTDADASYYNNIDLEEADDNIRTMTLTITERYYEESDVVIPVTVDDTDSYSPTLAELLADADGTYAALGIYAECTADKAEDASGTDDTATAVYTIAFTGADADGTLLDHDYVIGTIEMYDAADNYASLAPGSDAAFTVDRVDPVIEVEYSIDEPGTAEDALVYVNEDVTATITITERNIDTADILAAIEGTLSDGSGTDTPDVSWSTDGDTTTAVVKFTENADYSIGIDFTDRAGNEADTYETRYFTVDQAVPQISVAYTSGSDTVAVNENGSRVYEDDTVTAVITVSNEYNFYRTDGNTISFDDGQMDLSIASVDSDGSAVSLTANDDVDVETESAWISLGEGKWQKTLTFKTEANYTLNLTYTDLAGNSDTYGAAKFTVDETDPEGSITISSGSSKKTWKNTLSSVLSFGFFAQNDTEDAVSITIDSDDETSGVRTVSYYLDQVDTAVGDEIGSYETLTYDELAALSDSSWTSGSSVNITSENQKALVYARITDNSGWTIYINAANGVIVDNANPNSVKITITTEKPDQNVYDGSVDFTIKVEDQNKNNSYSGIASVKYVVLCDGEQTQEKTFTDAYKNAIKRTGQHSGTINAKKNNSNNVRIKVTVTDKAGNTYTETSNKIRIDTTKPSINVSYDQNSPENGTYYSTKRTATITITERNFDASATKVYLTSSEGKKKVKVSWKTTKDESNPDNTKTVGTYTVGEGDDYTISVVTADKAGNSKKWNKDTAYTIDLTDPVMDVSFNNNDAVNGKYYNASRTATVTITEHNFDASGFEETVTAALNESNISVDSFGSFQTSGDVHTASVTYSSDADYTFELNFTDLAGREAVTWTEDDFTIDTTDPVLTFTGVKNKQAYSDESLTPGVEVEDVNCERSGITVTLEGYRDTHSLWELTSANSTTTTSGNTISVVSNDIEDERANDDVYIMEVTAEDLAGNTVTDQIMFSVNRYGSTYYIEENSATEALLEQYYTNEAQDIEVHEVNVNAIASSEVSYVLNGSSNTLGDSAYSRESVANEDSWKEYVYTIAESFFTEEGEYSFVFGSTDKAGNTSRSDLDEHGEDGALDVSVCYDITTPDISYQNIASNGRYTESEHEIGITIDDALSGCDELAVYVDDEVYASFNADDGSLTEGVPMAVSIAEMSGQHTIQIYASDRAGNTIELGSEGNTFENVTISTSAINKLLANKAILVLIIVVILVIIFLIWFFLFFRRRRKKDEEEEAV